MGGNDEILYGVSVTNADVIMSDGNSLEHIGVMPNQRVITTPADLAANRDPVLAMAIKLLGGDISPEQAGKIFQYKWRESGNNELIEIVVN
jgi:C-terminal processing protease CtpA/Prc